MKLSSSTALRSNDVDPTFGDMSRYYEMMTFIVVPLLIMVLPVLYWEVYSVWKKIRGRSTADSKEVLRSFLFAPYLITFSCSVMITMPIPTSLQLALAHGGTPSSSGLLVSCYVFGLPMMLACRFITLFSELLWPASVRLYVLLQILCMALVAILACMNPFAGSFWCLLGSKLIGGVAHGLFTMKVREHVVAALDRDDLFTVSLGFMICSLSGTCLGPCLGSLVVPAGRTLLASLGGEELNPGAYCALFQLGWMLLVMPCLIFLTPAETHIAGIETEDSSGELYREAPKRVRLMNAAIGISLLLFKDMGASAIEVFDILMLELDYGFSTESSGFFASVSMLVALPLILSYTAFSYRIPKRLNEWCRRLSLVVPVVASFASYEALCPFGNATKCVLYMMIARVFTYVFWAIGISWIEGGFFKWCVSEKDHVCSHRNMAFYYSLAVEGFTRGLGPFLVRAFYEHTGRLGACIFLTSCDALVLAIAWLGLVLPNGKFWT